MDHSLVTTNIQLDGYRVVKNLGVVRGIIVRSRSIFGNIGAGIQTIFGGNITFYSELCEQTRSDAYELMIRHAEKRGANAVDALGTAGDDRGFSFQPCHAFQRPTMYSIL